MGWISPPSHQCFCGVLADTRRQQSWSALFTFFSVFAKYYCANDLSVYGHVLPSFIDHVMHSWQYDAGSLSSSCIFNGIKINHVERLAKIRVSDVNVDYGLPSPRLTISTDFER